MCTRPRSLATLQRLVDVRIGARTHSKASKGDDGSEGNRQENAHNGNHTEVEEVGDGEEKEGGCCGNQLDGAILRNVLGDGQQQNIPFQVHEKDARELEEEVEDDQREVST